MAKGTTDKHPSSDSSLLHPYAQVRLSPLSEEEFEHLQQLRAHQHELDQQKSQQRKLAVLAGVGCLMLLVMVYLVSQDTSTSDNIDSRLAASGTNQDTPSPFAPAIQESDTKASDTAPAEKTHQQRQLSIIDQKLTTVAQVIPADETAEPSDATITSGTDTAVASAGSAAAANKTDEDTQSSTAKGTAETTEQIAAAKPVTDSNPPTTDVTSATISKDEPPTKPAEQPTENQIETVAEVSPPQVATISEVPATKVTTASGTSSTKIESVTPANQAKTDSGAALSDDEAIAIVQAWAKAWSSQVVEDYLAFYATTFDPSNGLSRSSWVVQRRQRVSGPAWIEVDVSWFRIAHPSSDRVEVTFLQHYKSGTFDDRITKKIVLVPEDNTWKFVSEQVVR